MFETTNQMGFDFSFLSVPHHFQAQIQQPPPPPPVTSQGTFSSPAMPAAPSK
jgi:hypothetical protein